MISETNHWTSLSGTGQPRVRYLNENSLGIYEFKQHFHYDFPELVIPNEGLSMDNKQKSNGNYSCKMIKCSKELKINFWDLSQNVRLDLSKGFTIRLFDSCGISLRKLAKELRISYPFVCHLRRNMYSIPQKIVLILSDLSGIPLEDIQKNIVSIRTRSGIKTSLKFPIKGNRRIASLIGHVFGDGYIGRNKKQFEFSNTNPNLINEVKDHIWNLFGLLPMTEKETRIGYPAIVGEILERFGAPIAPKIHSKELIPDWISTSKKCTAAFLRAFFDDDGSVMLSRNYNAKSLNLHVIRHIRKKGPCYNLLSQVSLLLKEFGIYSGKPIISKQYEKSDGIRLVMYINITDYQSLVNFYKTVGLTDGNKSEKLKKIVNTKIYPRKANDRKVNEKIMHFLLQKEYASTAEVSDYIREPRSKAIQKLKQLQHKRLVKIIGKVAPNRSYLWKCQEGD